MFKIIGQEKLFKGRQIKCPNCGFISSVSDQMLNIDDSQSTSLDFSRWFELYVKPDKKARNKITMRIIKQKFIGILSFFPMLIITIYYSIVFDLTLRKLAKSKEI